MNASVQDNATVQEFYCSTCKYFSFILNKGLSMKMGPLGRDVLIRRYIDRALAVGLRDDLSDQLNIRKLLPYWSWCIGGQVARNRNQTVQKINSNFPFVKIRLKKECANQQFLLLISTFIQNLGRTSSSHFAVRCTGWRPNSKRSAISIYLRMNRTNCWETFFHFFSSWNPFLSSAPIFI